MIARERDGTSWARVERVLPLDADAAWHLVADARHHAGWVPLTRVGLQRPDGVAWAWEPRPDDSAPEAGDVVVAVSGPTARRGGPGMVDRMRIERFEPPLGQVPGVAVFVKHGPVLLGTARIEVAAAGPGRARVTWAEQVHLRGLPPALTRGVGTVLLDGMLTLVLRRAAREAARQAQRTAA
ncbi:hypothetical protein KQI48_12475 [Cellulomonas hominis]|uniref:hypothetical protein n=1 Tax=Cellulomonas hominis TaxID=156981 RepID=UPI0014441ADF|nr:hypothetical protein [Cellulomonas hominis]MBU5423481.1 hypothetical protein [Cellulomonas hominis]NKY12384.1 hypothetical protein [Cellulomonas hominis]